MGFSFIPSAGNMEFVVDEAAVQQAFPMLVISPPLLYISCHQGLVQHAAVPGTESDLTATSGTIGCSTRDSVSPHCCSRYDRLKYQGLSLTSLLQLVKQAAVPGTQSHLTATAGTIGCSTRD